MDAIGDVGMARDSTLIARRWVREGDDCSSAPAKAARTGKPLTNAIA
jgi:hypothetical protein